MMKLVGILMGDRIIDQVVEEDHDRFHLNLVQYLHDHHHVHVLEADRDHVPLLVSCIVALLHL